MATLRTIIRYGFAPLLFVGSIGSALYVVGSGASKVWLLSILLAAIGTSFAAEWFAPYERIWNRSKGDGLRDFLHALVNETLNVVSTASIPLLAAFAPASGAWPSAWPLWAQLAFAIVAADIGITLAHYWSHKLEALWRLHSVHHSVERMYGFNGLMKHPVHQTIETIAGTTPLLIIGMPVDIGVLLGFSVAIQLLLQHSNVDMRVGSLIRLWAVAPGHRHHHVASKTRGDVNFGLFTMLWDHLLGTFVCDRPSPRDGELGVAGRPDFPAEYWDQLVEPFRNWTPNQAPDRGARVS